MNISEILTKRATAYPETTAIIDTHRGCRRVTTFAEMEATSACLATQLQQTNLQPGDAVLVFQAMSAELYIILAAIFRLELVAMFLDPGQGRDHIDQCCRLHPPKALIASPKAHLLRLVSPALRRIPDKFMVTGVGRSRNWGLLGQARTTPQSKIRNLKSEINRPALLTFTSGSTGQPKAALRTHSFLLAQHRALADSLKLTAGQVDLTTMPIVALANLASGVTSLIPKADLRYPGKIDPAPVVAQIQVEGVTSTVASPALLERLAHYCLSRQIILPGLQRIFTGGAPVFPHLLGQLQQVAPQAEVVAVYGSTEAEPMAKIAHHQIQSEDIQAMLNGRGVLAGPPIEAIRLRIMQDQWGKSVGPYREAEFESACCPPEEIGEIVVSGEHVLSGYLHGQGDEETKFRVGDTLWHRTGDAGYLDWQGRLWLLGRCAARIEDEHGILYPFAVECAASHHPALRRAAIISHKGRRVIAVELYENSTTNDLPSLKENLAWAYIDEVRALKHIPVDKRHNAKVDYPALHKLLESNRYVKQI